MVEFNPDGSIKLPSHMQKSREEKEYKMKHHKIMKVRREVTKLDAPKECILHLTLSDAITDDRFITTIFNQVQSRLSTPTKLERQDEKNFTIKVGTDFKRCSDCTLMRAEFREFLGNIIDEKGNCTYEGRKSFSYEDYFD